MSEEKKKHLHWICTEVRCGSNWEFVAVKHVVVKKNRSGMPSAAGDVTILAKVKGGMKNTKYKQ